MVRGEMGLKNVDMIPFVRTLEMAKDVNEVLASRLVNRTQASRLQNRRPNASGVTRNHDFADLMVEIRSFNFIRLLNIWFSTSGVLPTDDVV